MKEELGEILGSLARGEAAAAALAQDREHAHAELEELVRYWGEVVLGERRERERAVLVDSLGRAGFPTKMAPIVMLEEEYVRSGEALGRLSTALSSLPRRRAEVAGPLQEFLRLTRLRLDLESDLLVLLSDLLEEGPETSPILPHPWRG